MACEGQAGRLAEALAAGLPSGLQSSNMERLGALAAFGTAIFWTASALTFEGATRRVGALAVNFYKVVGAFLLLAVAGLATRGLAFPVDASPRNWLYLSLSGLIGFVVADYFLFNAYVHIGSRVTVVFQALTPLFTAAFGWLILGESMEWKGLVGMAAVVGGIMVLVVSRNAAKPGAGGRKVPAPAHAVKGYVFAFLSSVFQALGLIVSKLGLDGIGAIPATQIRVLVAIAGFGLQGLLLGQARGLFVDAPRDGVAMKRIALGAVVGPFLGVVLSLYALQHTNAGTASTLMALTPVLIIPPAVILMGQKVAPGEVVGACIAVAGTALFFLV
jgi:drug/metabolite transporter (DMT)-like permease